MTWIIITIVGLVAGTLSGIVGFGSTTILMPLLVIFFGPKAAVPIMAVAAVLGNLGRVVVWWPVIAWRAVAAFSLTAIGAVWFGAKTMLAFDPVYLELFLGAFFILMIPIRRWFVSSELKLSLLGLAMAGAVIGFLTGIVANTGPINTPFFLAHGLIKGPFIATEAMSSLAMFGSKSAAFWTFGALPAETITRGCIVGATLMIGAWLAKRFVQNLSTDAFKGLMDVLLLVAGGAMIVNALSGSGL
ncbi:MAG: sulfite exporter TauE/SafE family protein [Alphaproteobacteria bacterium]|nr:sulfite exporter TauE/SafE family protein [Alphaproteobacteria bacterium]